MIFKSYFLILKKNSLEFILCLRATRYLPTPAADLWHLFLVLCLRGWEQPPWLMGDSVPVLQEGMAQTALCGWSKNEQSSVALFSIYGFLIKLKLAPKLLLIAASCSNIPCSIPTENWNLILMRILIFSSFAVLSFLTGNYSIP